MGGTANGYHCKAKDIAEAIALARKEGNVGAVEFMNAMKEVVGHTLSVRESDYSTYKTDRKSANDDLTNVLDVLDTYT
ncbi:MAG: hypothetical protein KGH60_03850 [Candidatus Micrarchaeota archaeon]|nr:hypothetical protein [Candidatus Micrarchaeota archaeon]